MKTVPLYGRKAAGRVALVDDEDYDLVMQYRWNVWEPEPKRGHRQMGPYAVTTFKKDPAGRIAPDGRKHTLRMHILIMGQPGIDHHNHDGLDNQRHNLRVVTQSQNNQNTRGRVTRSSQYKGVCWIKREGKWRVSIGLDGRQRRVGDFLSEVEAAYAYDEAARGLFGEYAHTNFSESPTQAMRGRWQVEREEHARKVDPAAQWNRREPEMRTCQQCGSEYQSIAIWSLYCSRECCATADLHRKRERRIKSSAAETAGKLF